MPYLLSFWAFLLILSWDSHQATMKLFSAMWWSLTLITYSYTQLPFRFLGCMHCLWNPIWWDWSIMKSTFIGWVDCLWNRKWWDGFLMKSKLIGWIVLTPHNAGFLFFQCTQASSIIAYHLNINKVDKKAMDQWPIFAFACCGLTVTTLEFFS